LYLKLYDDLLPQLRAGFDGFIRQIGEALEGLGIAVVRAPVCCVASELAAAVAKIEAAGADCLVTLHLAYSPSLEAIDVLCRTRLGLVLLDTTMDTEFGVDVAPERIMYNHGVHGVMDLACMLRRRKREFDIVAGHYAAAGVMERTADLVRANYAAGAWPGSRVLRVGEVFAGMGDFAVAEETLAAKLGIHVSGVDMETLDAAIGEVSDEAVTGEVGEDRGRFVCELPAEAHWRSAKVGLGLRQMMEMGGYDGLSVNFQAFNRSDRPANTMPFLEISKAMGRGIGYGGEGDVLTASLVGALACAFGAVTFTEVFCADWAGENLFLSHMGEISPAVAGDRPRIIAKPLFSGGSLDPAILTCAVKPGPAALVNLAPGADDSFSLIVAPVEVLAEGAGLASAMRDTIRAWVRPRMKVGPFLEAYAQAGGTHHSALVIGERAKAVAVFGRRCGLKVVELPQE